MKTIAVKCPCCGGTYSGDFNADYLVCKYCDTKFVIKSNEIKMIVDKDSNNDIKEYVDEYENIEFKNNTCKSFKDKATKHRVLAMATAIVLLAGGILAGSLLYNPNKNPSSTAAKPDKRAIVGQLISDYLKKNRLSKETSLYLQSGDVAFYLSHFDDEEFINEVIDSLAREYESDIQKKEDVASTYYGISYKSKQDPTDELRVEFEEPKETMTFDMDLRDYEIGVSKAYKEISKYINYDNMKNDIYSFFYLVNYGYITDELEKEIIEKGYIKPNDLFDDEGKLRASDEGMTNFDNYSRLKNYIMDYNERKAEIGGKTKEIASIGEYIDPSVLCMTEEDKEIVHNLFVYYVEGYDLTPNSIMHNKDYLELSKKLLVLDGGQLETSPQKVGIRWMINNVIGYYLMDFEQDYMLANYSMNELSEYFEQTDLNFYQFVLKGTPISYDSSSELCLLAKNYGQHRHFFIDNGFKELLTLIKKDEIGKHKTALAGVEPKSF